MAEDEAALKEYLREVPEAQLVAESPQHDEQNQSGRVLAVIERGAGALIENPATGAAAEGALAQGGAPGLRSGRGRGTVGAGHEHLLHTTANVAILSMSS